MLEKYINSSRNVTEVKLFFANVFTSFILFTCKNNLITYSFIYTLVEIIVYTSQCFVSSHLLNFADRNYFQTTKSILTLLAKHFVWYILLPMSSVKIRDYKEDESPRRKKKFDGGDGCEMFTDIVNRKGDPSSKPERGCLHFSW